MKLLSLAVLSGVLILVHTTYAEYRIWTNDKGYSIEAEYLAAKGDQVALKKRDGTIIKIKVSSLSEEDQDFLKKVSPAAKKRADGNKDDSAGSDSGREKDPRLDIEFKRMTDTERTGSSNHYRNRDTVCSVTITKKSQQPYTGELKATLHVIGEDEYDRLFVILDTVSKSFDFNTSKEISFNSSHFTLQDCNCSSNHGTQYDGYLIVITDSSDRVIAVKSSSSKYESARVKLSEFGRGQYFDKQFNKEKKVETNTYY